VDHYKNIVRPNGAKRIKPSSKAKGARRIKPNKAKGAKLIEGASTGSKFV
jgi:hypothetical protein